jgi:uncharacterized Zn finger protein
MTEDEKRLKQIIAMLVERAVETQIEVAALREILIQKDISTIPEIDRMVEIARRTHRRLARGGIEAAYEEWLRSFEGPVQ